MRFLPLSFSLRCQLCACVSLFLSLLASTPGSFVHCVLGVWVCVWVWHGVGYGVSGESSRFELTRGWRRWAHGKRRDFSPGAAACHRSRIKVPRILSFSGGLFLSGVHFPLLFFNFFWDRTSLKFLRKKSRERRPMTKVVKKNRPNNWIEDPWELWLLWRADNIVLGMIYVFD